MLCMGLPLGFGIIGTAQCGPAKAVQDTPARGREYSRPKPIRRRIMPGLQVDGGAGFDDALLLHEGEDRRRQHFQALNRGGGRLRHFEPVTLGQPPPAGKRPGEDARQLRQQPLEQPMVLVA